MPTKLSHLKQAMLEDSPKGKEERKRKRVKSC
jgi:hypothetical protein